jgi:hypothetical protein
MRLTDHLLSEIIVAKLRAGELPARRPSKTWGGLSEGRVCAACDEAIGKGTAEMEVDSADRRQRYYHVNCYAVLSGIRDA